MKVMQKKFLFGYRYVILWQCMKEDKVEYEREERSKFEDTKKKKRKGKQKNIHL